MAVCLHQVSEVLMLIACPPSILLNFTRQYEPNLRKLRLKILASRQIEISRYPKCSAWQLLRHNHCTLCRQ